MPGAPDRIRGAAHRRSAPIEELRVRTFDTFQRIEPRVKTQRPVTIVDIDEKSLAKFGQWPWPRTRIADMIANLTKLGAVVIALRHGVLGARPAQSRCRRRHHFAISTRRPGAKLRALPSNDQIFADAMRRSRVVLGETGLAKSIPNLDKTLPVTGIGDAGRGPQRFMFNFPGLLRNMPVLEQAAAGRGLFTINPERDGIVRRVPMIMQAQGVTMPSLSFEMLRVVTGSRHHLHQTDQAGIKSVGCQGFPDSDRPQRPALGSFRAARSLDLCFGGRRARRQCRAREDQRASWC